MKAIVQEEYGPPDRLRLADVEKPAAGDGDVLVRVRAAALNPADYHFMRGEPRFIRLASGLRRPRRRVPGSDVSGTVEAVGARVIELRPGDDVFGSSGGGALAEYAAGPATSFVPKPQRLTFEQAAGIPIAGCTALQGLRDHGQLQEGDAVLVNGAGGGVGTFAVQIAKAYGAEVTAVCSATKVDVVRSIGADRVIDYTREDFTGMGQRFDVILDMVGNHSIAVLRRLLTPRGRLVLGGGDTADLNLLSTALVLLKLVRQTRTFVARIRKEDLLALKELVETTKLTPVVDRAYPLNEVADAIRYLEEGHARGKIVITI